MTAEEALKLLGLPKDATDESVAAVYHNLVMAWHPDRHQAVDTAAAEEHTKRLNLAYEALKDGTWRRAATVRNHADPRQTTSERASARQQRRRPQEPVPHPIETSVPMYLNSIFRTSRQQDIDEACIDVFRLLRRGVDEKEVRRRMLDCDWSEGFCIWLVDRTKRQTAPLKIVPPEDLLGRKARSYYAASSSDWTDTSEATIAGAVRVIGCLMGVGLLLTAILSRDSAAIVFCAGVGLALIRYSFY